MEEEEAAEEEGEESRGTDLAEKEPGCCLSAEKSAGSVKSSMTKEEKVGNSREGKGREGGREGGRVGRNERCERCVTFPVHGARCPILPSFPPSFPSNAGGRALTT